MNKSHTVSYGMISYWCACMKAEHPLEWTAANLRHTKGKDSAIKILRDAVENDGIEYIAFDPDESELDWSVKDGKLIGGLINLKGIAEKKAENILDMRRGIKKYTESVVKLLMNPITDFDTLYPCYDKWCKIYDNPDIFGVAKITKMVDIIEPDTYYTIGKLISKDLRDLNEYNELVKRNGEVYEENNFMLKLILEDDTDQLYCKINRFNFNKLKAKHIAETGIEDTTYYIIKGKVKAGWRMLDVQAIYDLTTDVDNIIEGDK